MTPEEFNALQAFVLIAIAGALALAFVRAFYVLGDYWRVRPDASRY